MKKLNFTFLVFMLVFGLSSCDHIRDYLEEVEPNQPVIEEFATGLTTPLALELDPHHRLWVTEAGTGMQHDGQVSVIMPNGQVYTVIEGFVSVFDPEGNPSGLNHLLYDDGKIWFLHGVERRLYWADVADFVPGQAPLQASELQYQELGDFIQKQFVGQESNLYNLIKGPEGDLFLVDASVDAIIRRDAETAGLSVFAQFPPIENPTPVGPPLIDPVPTGIIYDGNRFLVSTLTGFPFLQGEAKVYQVDREGEVSVYQDGLTTLVDIELDVSRKPLVLQFSEFGQTGWIPGTGKIIQVTDEDTDVLRTGLSFASDMELFGVRKAYVTNLAEGKVLKVRY